MNTGRPALANLNGFVVLVAAFLAGAQAFNLATPDAGLPYILFSVFFLVLLLNTLAASPDRVRVLRRLLDVFQVREHPDPRRAVFGYCTTIKNRYYAWKFQSSGKIQALDPRMSIRTSVKNHMSEPWQPQVIDIGTASLQQALCVRPRHRLADIAAIHPGARSVQRQLSFAHSRPPRWRRRSPGSPCSGSNCRKCDFLFLPWKPCCPAKADPEPP